MDLTSFRFAVLAAPIALDISSLPLPAIINAEPTFFKRSPSLAIPTDTPAEVLSMSANDLEPSLTSSANLFTEAFAFCKVLTNLCPASVCTGNPINLACNASAAPLPPRALASKFALIAFSFPFSSSVNRYICHA